MTSLADDGVVPAREPRDELVGVGSAGGRLELLDGRVRLPESEVVRDRAVEEVAVLEHDGHLRPQCMEAQRSHINIAHEHAALLRVVEPLQQPDQGGLPRAAAADDGDALAGRDAE